MTSEELQNQARYVVQLEIWQGRLTRRIECDQRDLRRLDHELSMARQRYDRLRATETDNTIPQNVPNR